MIFTAADTYRCEFTTYAGAPRVLTNATGTPTGTLVVNGADGAAVVTVTNPATGRYKASVPLAGLSAGDVAYLRITATVAGVVEELALPPFRLVALSSAPDLRGAGADEVTITLTDDNGDPVADADVWLTNGGGVVVAGTLQTDSAGQATFLLDDGVTYYLWSQKDGVNGVQGEAFVAEAD